MNITTVGIDLAKNSFQLHGVDFRGKAILKKKISRQKLLSNIANLPKCKIFMEACGAANYWGREFTALGHEVKLISPQYVKPFVKTNKNDRNDAEAIVEAGVRPSMRFVSIKTTEQQDIQSVHRIRDRLITQRTALANQVRGFLMEYGIFIAKGICKLRKELPVVLENSGLSGLMKENVRDLYDELKWLDERVEKMNQRITQVFEQNEVCKKLAQIPGVGKLGATMLATTLGDGKAFKNGRHFSAFSGLVPKQCSSGGREKLLGISKRGDAYLRTLLIHGARAVVTYAGRKKDKDNVWLNNLVKRVGVNKPTVAWANKIGRRAWAMVYYGTEYQPGHMPKTIKLRSTNVAPRNNFVRNDRQKI
jgi:transposase